MKTESFSLHHDLPAIAYLLTKNIFKLCIAGVMIGILHSQDALVALILSVYMVLTVGKKFYCNTEDRFIYFVGMILSSGLGVVCELWGIYFGYWEYHDLPEGRSFPFWLPFAWGLAFTYIYKIEKELIELSSISGFWEKLVIALSVAMIFPTIGEIITINLGVWTYYWPYQIFGVPLLAIFLLMVFHTGVNFLMTLICRMNKWIDPFFNPGTDIKK